MLITGFCGAGKSTLAAYCSSRFKWKLVDFDEWVRNKTGLELDQVVSREQNTSKEPSGMFAQYFNDFQHDLYRTSNVIIAAPYNFLHLHHNSVKLYANTFLVWLCTDLETMWMRTAKSSRYQHIFGSREQFDQTYHEIVGSYSLANAVIFAQPELDLNYMAIQHAFRAF